MQGEKKILTKSIKTPLLKIFLAVACFFFLAFSPHFHLKFNLKHESISLCILFYAHIQFVSDLISI